MFQIAIPTITANDNCTTAMIVFHENKIDGSCPGNYKLQRIWTASDTNGNETTYTQIINVNDTTPPTFTTPLPSADLDATCNTIPDASSVTATDNCGNATVDFTETKVDGDCSSRYTLNRTWTATDSCGNQNVFTQRINVSCLAEIYNVISPTGDDQNDTFMIGGIDCHPNNTVEIFNRYGRVVYKKNGYDNITDPFEGFSQVSSTFGKGNKLPGGTYFYTLEYDNNGTKIKKSGYLFIASSD